MTSNIFIKDFSNNILYNFLDEFCIIENNYYIFNKEIYKKYEYFKKLDNFYELMKSLYKSNKKYYLERNYSYNNLLTIIRHICKKNKIIYFNKIIYNKSKYSIIYYIKKM